MKQEARDLRVAAVQMRSENGDIEGNLERATTFAEQAARDGAQLVVFPEFMPTGYIFTEAVWDAGEPSNGPTARWLSETAKRLGVWLGTSFLEAEGDRFFNTFLLTAPNGKPAGRVRKQKPAAVEACFFEGACGDHVIDTGFGRVGVGICYENQLSFMLRLMYEQSADIILMPHSAPAPTPTPLLRRKSLEQLATVLESLAPTYAQALGVPVAYINKSGPFESPVPGMPFYKQRSHFPGESTIVDSDCVVKGRLGSEEGIVVADVRLDPARKATAPPRTRGRWAVKEPLEMNAFPVSEAISRALYTASRERKRRARRISAREG